MCVRLHRDCWPLQQVGRLVLLSKQAITPPYQTARLFKSDPLPFAAASQQLLK